MVEFEQRAPDTSELPDTDLLAGGLPSAEELRVHFPAHDFDGYWFFGGLEPGSEFDALMFGLSLGANDGYDWGFSDVAPDPDFGIYVAQLIGKDQTLSFGSQPVHRHEFVHDRRSLDVRLPERAALRVQGDRLHASFRSDDGSARLELQGTLAPHSFRTPDMVFRRTCFVSLALPTIRFEAVYSDPEREVRVEGVGILDHPSGRVRPSDVSVGMGWWEYNCFRLSGGESLFQWFIVDRAGDHLFDTLVTTYPDGELHTGRVELVHLDWEQRGPVAVPRRWAVHAEADHGSFDYEVHAAGPDWDGVPLERGVPYPNFALELTGSFTPDSPGAAPVDLVGNGTGETVVSERDPYSGSPQSPWEGA